MDPFPVVTYLVILLVGSASVLTLFRAISARIAGPYSQAISSPLINVTFNALPHPKESEENQENAGETGNTATLENTGNNGETMRETMGMSPLAQSNMALVNDTNGSHVSPLLTREDYHELVEVRVHSIALLEACVKYYAAKEETDCGVIPRYDEIHMKSANRQAYVNDLWYSQFVIKAPKKTMVDPALYQSCKELMEAIKANRAKVYPMGYLEKLEKRRMDAVNALPGITR